MAGRLYIEARNIDFVGLASGVLHLYLVHRDIDGREYVLRAGPDRTVPIGADMRVELNIPIERSRDDRGGDTPEKRKSSEVVLPGRTPDEAWALMVKYAAAIAGADYPYVLFQENSNAFIGALLEAAGGDAEALLPVGVASRDAVGFAYRDEILDDIPPPPNGTVFGTAGADLLRGIQAGEVFRAGDGDDRVRAGRGDDLVYGGGGDDRLFGQFGFDTLRGGAGNDRLHAGASGDPMQPDAGTQVLADRLYGGTGRDRLFGSDARDILHGGRGADMLDGGGGRDRLTGGPGDDVFRFREDVASTARIVDFEDGGDRIRILSETLAGFADLAIETAGRDGRHAALGFGDSRILLLDTDAAQLDAKDFVIVPEAGLIA